LFAAERSALVGYLVEESEVVALRDVRSVFSLADLLAQAALLAADRSALVDADEDEFFLLPVEDFLLVLGGFLPLRKSNSPIYTLLLYK
jgi:hypothetical protein